MLSRAFSEGTYRRSKCLASVFQIRLQIEFGSRKVALKRKELIEEQDAVSEMLELEAFSWSLEVPYGGLKRKIFIKKYFSVSTVIFIRFLITKILGQDPYL